jgi:hypothetical protein
MMNPAWNSSVRAAVALAALTVNAAEPLAVFELGMLAR